MFTVAPTADESIAPQYFVNPANALGTTLSGSGPVTLTLSKAGPINNGAFLPS
jgi:homoserine kinase